MQFDRYYAPGVAFEFNGPQHCGPTDHYRDETQVLKQQARDYMKQRICVARGIHLAVIHPEDLTLERMRERRCVAQIGQEIRHPYADTRRTPGPCPKVHRHR